MTRLRARQITRRYFRRLGELLTSRAVQSFEQSGFPEMWEGKEDAIMACSAWMEIALRDPWTRRKLQQIVEADVALPSSR